MTAQLDALLVRVIRIEAVASQMKFDVSRITVTAGETVVIELVNKDEMPHNLVVGKEGALETIGLAADKMVALPDAFAKNFVPSTPEVLFSIRLLNPGETVQARFTAPTQTGNYPFICTFPAHWRTMNGIIDVAGRLPASPAMTRLLSLLLVMAGCLAAQSRRHRRRARGPHVVFVTGDDEYRDDFDADDRGHPREAARSADERRLRAADAADQGSHRRSGGARHRRPDGDVHAYRALPDAELNRSWPT